jgi:hypothetical protein
MVTIGSHVKVLDNYSGGLDNLKGRIGQVKSIKFFDEAVYPQYELDINGDRTRSYQSYNGVNEYVVAYPALVLGNEVEEVVYEFKDINGDQVEIGDTIVYGAYGGKLTVGNVVDIDERIGYSNKEVKMKIQVFKEWETSDGDSCTASRSKFVTRWLSRQSSTLILSKVSRNLTVVRQ